MKYTKSLLYLRTRQTEGTFIIPTIKLEPLIQTGKNRDKGANYCAVSVYKSS